MRYHEPFTLIPRKMPSGLTIFYYRCRLPDGRRSTAWSTGQTSRSSAREHCRNLEKAGKLIPQREEPTKGLTFADLAKDFWSWENSEYVKARLRFSDPKKPAISQRYCRDMARSVERHLMKTFGRRIVNTITPQEIETFALRLRDGGLSGHSVNNIVTCMRVMLAEARRAGQLPWDPATTTIRALGSATKKRGRLTREEVVKLFAEDNIETAWKGNTLYRAINFVAAATGMRQGEILAIRDRDIYDGFISVEHSYDPIFGLGPTKTRTSRNVPLPPRVMEAVRPFMGSGFVFSKTDGETPCKGQRITEALYDALKAIGVTDREERNVTFHSWRHWLNSMLRAQAVPDPLVRRVTGHATEEMTENYTQYLAEDYAPVVVAQAEVFK